MKKIFIYASMACAIVLSGCSSMDNIDSQAPNTTLSANVESSAEMRTYLGNYDGATQNYAVLWQDADHIGVYDAGTWKDFTLTNGKDAARATFSGNLSAVPTTYKAFYPYSIVSGSSDAATITLPATQTYRNEGIDHTASQKVIAQDMWPAYSEYGSQPLPFKNLCGAIRFNVKCAADLAGGTITGAKLTVTGTAKGLSGQYTVSDYSATTGPALTAVSGKTANTVSLTGVSGLTLNTSTASSIYFVLPPQTYLTDGVETQNLNLEVTVTQADGTSAIYSRSLSKGTGYNLVVNRSQITQLNMTLYKNGLTYDNAYLFWGNEDVSQSATGYVAGSNGKTDVNNVDFMFNLNTFKTYGGTYYIRIPAGMYWAGDASLIKAGTDGSGCVLGLTGPAKLEFNVYISPDMYTYSKDCNLYIFDGATYTAAQALTQDKANATYTAKVAWSGRLGYEAQNVTSVTYTSAVSEIQNSGGAFCTAAAPSKFTLTENTNALQVLSSSDPLKEMVNSRYSVWEVLNGTQRDKVFIEQTSLAFVASPIRYDSSTKHYSYTSGNMILVHGTGSQSVGFQVTGGDLIPNSTQYYVPNPSTGVVTAYTDCANENDAYTKAEAHAVAAGYTTKGVSPCDMVYPLHSFREATNKEAQRLVAASTMPGDCTNPYVRFSESGPGYNVDMRSIYDANTTMYFGGTGTYAGSAVYCMSVGNYKWQYQKFNDVNIMSWNGAEYANPTYTTFDTATNRAVTGNGYRVWGYNNNNTAMVRICVRR